MSCMLHTQKVINSNQLEDISITTDPKVDKSDWEAEEMVAELMKHVMDYEAHMDIQKIDIESGENIKNNISMMSINYGSDEGGIDEYLNDIDHDYNTYSLSSDGDQEAQSST